MHSKESTADHHRSSINDHRSTILVSSAVCRRPLLRHQISMVPAECKCKSSSAICSAGSKSPPMQAGSSSPPMHCSCWEPQKLGDRLNRESSVSDRRSWSSVFCIFLLFNSVFDFGYLEIWLKSIILSNLQLVRKNPS